MLYELLTGRSPYPASEQNFEKLMQTIVEQEPPQLSSVAEGNGKMLKGDLDDIVLKALRKEPEKRYQSVEQFAADIRRYINGSPILARRGTSFYRAAKFIKRHRTAVGLTFLVLILLLTGILSTIWHAQIARNQARLAAAEREKAQLTQIKAEKITQFLQKTLTAANPQKGERDIKIAAVLERAEKEAQAELNGQPEVFLEVLKTIAEANLNLLEYQAAERNFRLALELQTNVSGDGSLVTAELKSKLAEVLLTMAKYDEAGDLLEEAIVVQRKEQAANRQLAVSLLLFGGRLIQKGDNQRAEAVLQQALSLARSVEGEEGGLTLNALNSLALLQVNQSDFSAAISLYRQIIHPLRQLPDRQADLATALTNYGGALSIEGFFAEAETVLEEALTLRRQIFGDDNLSVAITLANLSRIRFYHNQYRGAAKIARQTLALLDRFLPKNHQMTVLPLTVSGRSLLKMRKLKEAENNLRQALVIFEKNYRQDDWRIANIKSQLGECLTASRRFSEAEPLLLAGFAGLKESFGEIIL